MPAPTLARLFEIVKSTNIGQAPSEMRMPPPQLSGHLLPAEIMSPPLSCRPEITTELLIVGLEMLNTRWPLGACKIVGVRGSVPTRLTALFSVRPAVYTPGKI